MGKYFIQFGKYIIDFLLALFYTDNMNSLYNKECVDKMAKSKQLLAILLALILTIGCFAGLPAAASGEPETVLGIYQIYTKEELLWAAEHPDGDYLLCADIDLSDQPNWPPIGGEEKAFSGSFNGGGHTVTLAISAEEKVDGIYFAGLFGVVSGTVVNLKTAGTLNASLYSGYVGGIAACLRGGRILDCESGVAIRAEGTTGILHAGGIVGAVRATSTVEGCVNNGDLEVKARNISGAAGDLGRGTHGAVGGIIGFTCDGVGAAVSRCVNNGNITVTGGADNVGGIVGQTSTDTAGSYVDIAYCANKGDLTIYKLEGERAAGIIGYVKRGSINYCYNLGSVKAYSDMGSTVSRDGYGTAFGIFGYANLSASNTLEVTYCYNASPSPLEAEICVVRNASHGTFRNFYMKGREEYELSLNSGNVSAGAAGTAFTDGSDLYAKLSADEKGAAAYTASANSSYPVLYFEEAQSLSAGRSGAITLQTVSAYCHNLFFLYQAAKGEASAPTVLLQNGDKELLRAPLSAVDTAYDGEKSYRAAEGHTLYALRVDSLIDDLWTKATLTVTAGGSAVFEKTILKDEVLASTGVEIPLDGLPDYPDGKVSPVYNCGPGMQNDRTAVTDEDSRMVVVSSTGESAFNTYIRRLLAQGFTETARTEIGANIHYALQKGEQKYYIYYTAAAQQVRIIEDNSSNILVSELDTDPLGTAGTEMYLYSIDYTHGEGQTTKTDYWQIDCGALVILKLADNSLFVIDGGHERQSSNAAKEALLAFMRQITGTPEGEKVRIRGWFFSHAHGDHVYLCHSFVDQYHDEIEIEAVLHNFPSYQVMSGGYDSGTFLMRESVTTYFPDCNYVKLHTGEQFSLQGVDFEVLHTHEDGVNDTGKNSISNFNDTSTVLRITIGGKTFVMLGDAYDYIQGSMLKMYTAATLKSDAVQTGHHGYNNLTSLYNAIRAPFVMYSNSEENAGANSGNAEKYKGAMNAAENSVAVFSDPYTVKITVEAGEIRYSYLPSYREGLYFDLPELDESLVPDSVEPAVDLSEATGKSSLLPYIIDKSIVGTAAASNNEPASRLLDGQTSTKFCTKTIPAVAAWQMKEAVSISHYVIYTANDNSKNPGRNPKKWVLCGSNDAENWTVIDAVSNAGLPDTDYTGVAFAVDRPAAYRYYVLKIFSNAGAEAMQISEIGLYGAGAADYADYTAVDAALEKAAALNEADYTAASWAKLQAAVEAVVRDLTAVEQATVDGYAAAIEAAITALVSRPADYTAVDAALERAAALKEDDYTPASWAKLQAAIEAVVRDLTAAEQARVDGYAAAIEAAISALIPKAVEMELTISTGMVTAASAEGRYDITWNARILFGGELEAEDINAAGVRFKNYGVYYGTGKDVLNDYKNATAAQVRQIVFAEGEDVDIYTAYGFRLKNVVENRVRAAMFYVEHELNGQNYILLSTVDEVVAVIAE